MVFIYKILKIIFFTRFFKKSQFFFKKKQFFIFWSMRNIMLITCTYIMYAPTNYHIQPTSSDNSPKTN